MIDGRVVERDYEIPPDLQHASHLVRSFFISHQSVDSNSVKPGARPKRPRAIAGEEEANQIETSGCSAAYPGAGPLAATEQRYNPDQQRSGDRGCHHFKKVSVRSV